MTLEYIVVYSLIVGELRAISVIIPRTLASIHISSSSLDDGIAGQGINLISAPTRATRQSNIEGSRLNLAHSRHCIRFFSLYPRVVPRLLGDLCYLSSNNLGMGSVRMANRMCATEHLLNSVMVVCCSS